MSPAVLPEMLSCRPAAWYYRHALHHARSAEEVLRVGLMAVDEMELLKEQVRELGEIPDRVYDPLLLVTEHGDPAQMDLEISV